MQLPDLSRGRFAATVRESIPCAKGIHPQSFLMLTSYIVGPRSDEAVNSLSSLVDTLHAAEITNDAKI